MPSDTVLRIEVILSYDKAEELLGYLSEQILPHYTATAFVEDVEVVLPYGVQT